MDLAYRMRLENQEQFLTLVRMHLSFELDLNTDDNEVTMQDRAKFKKRFNFNKKSKGCTSTKTVSPPAENYILTQRGIEQIRKLIEFLLLEQNVIQEGIFRRTGSLIRQNELRTSIDNGLPVNLSTGLHTVHDCASVLKGMLADLSEPLLTDTHYSAYCQIADLCIELKVATNDDATKEARLLHCMQLLILLLPIDNQTLLKDIINMLYETAKCEKSNKMSADSLATLFTPHLICPKKLSPEALHATSQKMSGVISFMIRKAPIIFDVPPKLSTDIRAYFVEQKRKRTMSPEHVLNESIASDSVANTVYTFVDREKTAEAHISNPTDTALAQLYAHIQSLPESSKKRKLIKQFNKENGHGTPLQLQILNRIKQPSTWSNKSGGRSLGDSIKRHIFQKSQIPRTPKQTAVLTPPNPDFHTPNHRPNNVKSRLLFQSHTISQLNNQPKIVDKSPKLRRSISASCLNETITEIQKTEDRKIEECNLEPVHGNNDNDDDNNKIILDSNIMIQNTTPIQLNCDAESNQNRNIILNHLDETQYRSNFRHLNARYRSEPNLNQISMNSGMNTTDVCSTPKYKKSFVETAPLTTGISLDNINSIQLQPQPNPFVFHDQGDDCDYDEILPLDDPDFEATSSSQDEYSWQDHHHRGSLMTPDLIDRQSISPITKSTQRMPKSMQESIMTPRSRKPVMLPGTLLGSSDQVAYQSSFSSLREEDEEDNTSVHEPGNQESLNEISTTISTSSQQESEDLTSPFRKYVSSRQDNFDSLADESFSSQPDDFASPTPSTMDMPSESEMSPAMRYFMNGNNYCPPSPKQSAATSCTTLSSPDSIYTARLENLRLKFFNSPSSPSTTASSSKRCSDSDLSREYSEFGDDYPKKKFRHLSGDNENDENLKPRQTSL